MQAWHSKTREIQRPRLAVFLVELLDALLISYNSPAVICCKYHSWESKRSASHDRRKSIHYTFERGLLYTTYSIYMNNGIYE